MTELPREIDEMAVELAPVTSGCCTAPAQNAPGSSGIVHVATRTGPDHGPSGPRPVRSSIVSPSVVITLIR